MAPSLHAIGATAILRMAPVGVQVESMLSMTVHAQPQQRRTDGGTRNSVALFPHPHLDLWPRYDRITWLHLVLASPLWWPLWRDWLRSEVVPLP